MSKDKDILTTERAWFKASRIRPKAEEEVDVVCTLGLADRARDVEILQGRYRKGGFYDVKTAEGVVEVAEGSIIYWAKKEYAPLMWLEEGLSGDALHEVYLKGAKYPTQVRIREQSLQLRIPEGVLFSLEKPKKIVQADLLALYSEVLAKATKNPQYTVKKKEYKKEILAIWSEYKKDISTLNKKYLAAVEILKKKEKEGVHIRYLVEDKYYRELADLANTSRNIKQLGAYGRIMTIQKKLEELLLCLSYPLEKGHEKIVRL